MNDCELLLLLFCLPVLGTQTFAEDMQKVEMPNRNKTILTPCTCAVFLSGQFVKGSRAQPKGLPALTHEYDQPTACNALGNRQCINKCLESLVKHLPNSPTIVCATSGRDCHKERAYLFYKNCQDHWINSNLAAGREYCCKDGVPYQCPLLS